MHRAAGGLEFPLLFPSSPAVFLPSLGVRLMDSLGVPVAVELKVPALVLVCVDAVAEAAGMTREEALMFWLREGMRVTLDKAERGAR
jgi:hypothetical protein